jgi:hypothetical protein
VLPEHGYVALKYRVQLMLEEVQPVHHFSKPALYSSARWKGAGVVDALHHLEDAALNYKPDGDKYRGEKTCSFSTDTATSVEMTNAALIHSLALTHRLLWVAKRVYTQSPGPLHLLTANTQLDMVSAIVSPAAPRCSSTLFLPLSR